MPIQLTRGSYRGESRTLDVVALAAFIAICLAAGALGSWLMGDFSAWYDALDKPAWTPPGALIGGVWTVLFVMMGTAAWLVWREPGVQHATVAFALFGVQLVLNVLWSGIFFGLREPGLALVEIVALWLAVAATMIAFGRIRKEAGWLFAPYLAWVTFAGFLNWTLWSMNAG